MIEIKKTPGQRILEIGCGNNRHPAADVAVDVRPFPVIDFPMAIDDSPWPIKDGDFDAILAQYVLEHVAFPKLPGVLQEMWRVLKPGGTVIITVPNTEAQLQWIKNNPSGWDGKDFYTSASEVLFGSNDYTENTHRVYLSPDVATTLLVKAGFEQVLITPYGARQTDMAIQARRPVGDVVQAAPTAAVPAEAPKHDARIAELLKRTPRTVVFDKRYFNGGGDFGGYAREGMRDFPCHWITHQHIMQRRPQSVLELACARGYQLKRLQDVGIPASGLEISKHCFMTRVCDGIVNHDLCVTPWPVDGQLDLAFSLAFWEHVPQEHVPAMLNELKRVSLRGLHGIDSGHEDDGFDKSHCNLRSLAEWRAIFDAHGLQAHEIVEKNTLEQGPFPAEVIQGDGKVKLEIGSHLIMNHFGWTNIDVHDLNAYAQQNGYKYLRHDVRQGLPFATGTVDMIHMSHVLEHFSYKDGTTLLRECRRVIKGDGMMRLAVPYVPKLIAEHHDNPEQFRDEYIHVNDAITSTTTHAQNLWALTGEGHLAFYDFPTIYNVLKDAGWTANEVGFRETSSVGSAGAQMLRETLDGFPCLSLYCEAFPQ